MLESDIRQGILDAGRRLYARNMLAAADGNISFRRDNSDILITPSGRSKAHIAGHEIARINLDGQVLEGRPSGERDMHLAIYRLCPLAKAVVHAHPPHAVGWSLARPHLTELPNESLSEIILGAGSIPIVPYARPTTEAMGNQLAKYLPKSRALILSRHGAVCWGESLDEALNGMERLEHSAQMLWIAETLGGAKALPADEVQALKAMRAQFGERLL
jgi:L-fuculose-phosphate aldolase